MYVVVIFKMLQTCLSCSKSLCLILSLIDLHQTAMSFHLTQILHSKTTPTDEYDGRSIYGPAISHACNFTCAGTVGNNLTGCDLVTTYVLKVKGSISLCLACGGSAWQNVTRSLTVGEQPGRMSPGH